MFESSLVYAENCPGCFNKKREMQFTSIREKQFVDLSVRICTVLDYVQVSKFITAFPRLYID